MLSTTMDAWSQVRDAIEASPAKAHGAGQGDHCDDAAGDDDLAQRLLLAVSAPLDDSQSQSQSATSTEHEEPTTLVTKPTPEVAFSNYLNGAGGPVLPLLAKFVKANRIFTMPTDVMPACSAMLFELLGDVHVGPEWKLKVFLSDVHKALSAMIPDSWLELALDLASVVAEKKFFHPV